MTDLFDFCAPSRHFAVIGNPVAHSKSPEIHSAFGRQCDIALDYQRIQVASGGFAQALSHFAACGGAGLNITLPFKVAAWQVCQRNGNRLSPRAERAEAVNTIAFMQDRSLFGDNTDGVGMVRDIAHNLCCPMTGKRVLVIGAGGAVRGVLGSILETNPAHLLVVNRTAAKATLLAQRFQAAGDNHIEGGGLYLANSHFDVVINGTAASVDGNRPDISGDCFNQHTLAYDMMYGEQPTLFMQWALAQGAGRASDGLGMLVEQAAESFRLWHGRLPQSAAVLSAIRKQ